jgi:hypothetical protein
LKNTEEEYVHVHDTEEAAEAQVGSRYNAASKANRKAWVEVVIARCEVETVSLIYHVILIYKFFMSSTII